MVCLNIKGWTADNLRFGFNIFEKEGDQLVIFSEKHALCLHIVNRKGRCNHDHAFRTAN